MVKPGRNTLRSMGDSPIVLKGGTSLGGRRPCRRPGRRLRLEAWPWGREERPTWPAPCGRIRYLAREPRGRCSMAWGPRTICLRGSMPKALSSKRAVRRKCPWQGGRKKEPCRSFSRRQKGEGRLNASLASTSSMNRCLRSDSARNPRGTRRRRGFSLGESRCPPS